MAASLSILLPVHNAESHLAASVADILDLAGDLAAQFELLILDEGSSDRTVEVASEIATRYPQVDVVRHKIRRGMGAVIETGLSRTSGDIIIMHDGIRSTDVSDMHRLWKLYCEPRHASRLAAGQNARSQTDGHRPESSRATMGGFHLLDRRSVVPRAKRKMRRREKQAWQPAKCHGVEFSTPDRPNFLSRLKQFALGE